MRLSLNGGEEFADGFEDIHAELIEAVGGSGSCGVYLPCAAAEDGMDTVRYWCNLALERLSATGAKVAAPAIVKPAEANDPKNAQLVADADWIYLGGGKPHVALKVLNGTRTIEALKAAAQQGKLIMGASAGAMMMCSRSFVISPEAMAKFDQEISQAAPGQRVDGFPPLECLGFVPNSQCLPHFDRGYSRRALQYMKHPAGITLIGIDEQTALTRLNGEWKAHGRGKVTLIRESGETQTFGHGQHVQL